MGGGKEQTLKVSGFKEGSSSKNLTQRDNFEKSDKNINNRGPLTAG